MATEFGKLNFAVGFNRTSAFPLDANSYFENYADALTAASGAAEVGSSDSAYYIGQILIVNDKSETDNKGLGLYQITASKTLVKFGQASSADEIGEVLRQAEELSKWTSDVQAYALEQALAGEHFDGWKLVEGRSNRTITDQIKAAELLKAAGFDEAILFKHELYGITQLEKNCGKKKLTEVIGELIEKPQGKPVLVPESDKREELNSADAAKADFK